MEPGRCHGHELIGVGSSSGLGLLPTLGKETRGAHSSASSPGHACHFGAAWHTGHGTQTAWKIAGVAQRDASDACPALCGDQKTQEKETYLHNPVC